MERGGGGASPPFLIQPGAGAGGRLAVRRRGLVCAIRPKLSQKPLMVDGKVAPLTAGMSATVEVVTGRRRVIDYLWSPIAKATQEAGRER